MIEKKTDSYMDVGENGSEKKGERMKDEDAEKQSMRRIDRRE